jgi:DNA-binding winged helix-turn-helix (wHTH) protein
LTRCRLRHGWRKLLRLIMPTAYSSPIDFRKVRSIGASYQFHLPNHHWGLRSVSPDRREVLADGRPVKLGGRAFDVLMALIEAHGAVVSKDALMARVWPGRIIEENSLAAQIVALRAGFGAERALIRTVSGRGYQFAGEIRNSVAEPGWSSVVAKLRRSAWRRRSPTGACCWRWTPASM